jgi:hypothetical protein
VLRLRFLIRWGFVCSLRGFHSSINGVSYRRMIAHDCVVTLIIIVVMDLVNHHSGGVIYRLVERRIVDVYIDHTNVLFHPLGSLLVVFLV